MPSDFALKTMNTVHHVILKATAGKLGWRVSGMPVVELTTTGRKSHQPRSVMLTSPYQDGDTLVVVASRGGDDHHPAWFLNLEAEPNVSVKLDGQPEPRKARVASAEEKAEIWPKIATAHKNYAGYQTKTTRDIPLVFLERPPSP